MNPVEASCEKSFIWMLNCDPMSFDKECELTNAHFHKNKKREDIKSHHYIISYDPADVTENGLTGEKAQAISLELAKQMFPGYQALVVTHTDGHNESGNIHTHIVINSVRKDAVERQSYMDKCDISFLSSAVPPVLKYFPDYLNIFFCIGRYKYMYALKCRFDTLGIFGFHFVWLHRQLNEFDSTLFTEMFL